MPSPFTIVAFGDSMTECKALEPSKRWPGLLQRRLNRASAGIRCEVVNAGVGGNTSREGLARLERDVLPHRPDLTLVQFGGNDTTPDPARAVPFDEYVRNLGCDPAPAAARGIRDGLGHLPPGDRCLARLERPGQHHRQGEIPRRRRPERLPARVPSAHAGFRPPSRRPLHRPLRRHAAGDRGGGCRAVRSPRRGALHPCRQPPGCRGNHSGAPKAFMAERRNNRG